MSQQRDQLYVYLNDHLAGSVAAIELLDNLIEKLPSHRLAQSFKNLRDEISADQATLQQLMEKLNLHESVARKAASWLTEKLSRIKFDLGQEDQIGLLQAVESLELGVTGKALLWRALATISANIIELQGYDFAELETRASNQVERLEAERLQLSREVLSDREHS